MHSSGLQINPWIVLWPVISNRWRRAFTDDGVFLEEAVVALVAAHLEDQLADVEQVVSTDAQLRGSTTTTTTTTRHTF